MEKEYKKVLAISLLALIVSIITLIINLLTF
nr:MAG TPA_asm: hypothetical protein [Caudoviricetes sp.]